MNALETKCVCAREQYKKKKARERARGETVREKARRQEKREGKVDD